SSVTVQPTSTNSMVIFQSAGQKCPVISNVASRPMNTTDIKSGLIPMPYQDDCTYEKSPSQHTDDTVDDVTRRTLLFCKIVAIILQDYVSLLAPFTVAVTLRFLFNYCLGS